MTLLMSAGMVQPGGGSVDQQKRLAALAETARARRRMPARAAESARQLKVRREPIREGWERDEVRAHASSWHSRRSALIDDCRRRG